MHKKDIENLIKELIEKITVKVNKIEVIEEKNFNTLFSVEVSEPHFFINHEGEALYALNHIVRRITEKNLSPTPLLAKERGEGVRSSAESILVDINDFQKKRIDSVRAVAHMMSERARYFKSSVEVDPMTAFERRIVHEFLSEIPDLTTESVGFGNTRRVVIKYVGDSLL